MRFEKPGLAVCCLHMQCVFQRHIDVSCSILSRVPTCPASDSSENKHEPNTDNYGMIINCTSFWMLSAGKKTSNICVWQTENVHGFGATPWPHALPHVLRSMSKLSCDSCLWHRESLCWCMCDSLSRFTAGENISLGNVCVCVCLYLGMCATWLHVCPQAHLSKWLNACTC